MRAFILPAAAMIALPFTAMASTLNDWEPRLANLNAKCRAAYTADISGCSAKDFQQDAICNAACVRGLQEMTALVQTACGDEDFGDATESENIILCFMAGDGPKSVCPNNASLQSSSVASTKTATKSSTASRTQTSTATSSSETETSTTTSASEEVTTSASSTSTLQLDTTSSAVSSATPTSSSSSEDDQSDGSGGGSPFDYVSSSRGVVFVNPVVTTLLTAILLAAMMR